MAKLNYNRPIFNKNLGIQAYKKPNKTKTHGHESHQLKRVKTEGHFGKLTCITCGGKFIKWLSRDEYFKY